MKAAILKAPGNLQIEEVRVPYPTGNEIRIKVQLAGICGSDSSMYHGKLAGAQPVIPGHEAIGIVDTLGDAAGKFQIGQRVTIHPNYFCGECPPCRKGLTNICRSKIRLGVDINGVMAEYAVIPEAALFAVPDTLPNEIAVFAEPLAVAAHALSLVELQSDDRVLVFGAGVIGQLTLQLALLRSKVITACDLVASRLELAARVGARRTLGDAESVADCESSFDVIYETSGAPGALEQAIKLAAPGGKIVLLGIPGQSHPIPTVQIVRKELQIFGSMIYTDEIPRSIEILSQGLIKTEPLVSGIISLEQLRENLENFSAPQRMKTLVKIEAVNG
jgi:2-desacetyl-2-hydroxyethyl bacteriochlorophyllide A dehydrogenase